MIGHTALNCWKRHQKNYRGPEKSAGAAYGSYGVDTNSYTDSGATNHITGELEKLHVRDRHNDNEQIHTARDGEHNTIGHVPPLLSPWFAAPLHLSPPLSLSLLCGLPKGCIGARLHHRCMLLCCGVSGSRPKPSTSEILAGSVIPEVIVITKHVLLRGGATYCGTS
jgi:hypothetical protein